MQQQYLWIANTAHILQMCAGCRSAETGFEAPELQILQKVPFFSEQGFSGSL
jgi:hypothetical protein